MRLNADGTVQMRVHCNRANGSWSSQPAADPTSGQFAFGPLAGTRALRPPPSLDERITAQAQYVRSCRLKDGRLLVHLVGPTPCGTGGCPTLVFTPSDAAYVLVSTIGVTRPPSARRLDPAADGGT